tara:strand:- start:101 stop:358 length:258 start_codon:yes stop_codon:yes gene_type:complete
MERENMDNENLFKSDNTKTKRRCLICNKKLGLIGGFECRCGGLFCNLHRSENTHDCSFNFAEAGMNGLAGRLVVIGTDKVDKIGV